jgi:hypothetical protein
MERRFLAVVLGLAATFVLCSRGLDAGMIVKLKQPLPTLLAELKCATLGLGSKALSKVSPSLAADLEQARLLAELNLSDLLRGCPSVQPSTPVVPSAPAAPAKVEVAVAQPKCPELVRAQQKALRDTQKMQRKLAATQRKLEVRQRQMDAYPQLASLGHLDQDISEAVNRQVELSLQAAQDRLADQALQVQIAAEALANAQQQMARVKLQSHNVVATFSSEDGDFAEGAACKRSTQMQAREPVSHQAATATAVRGMKSRTAHPVPATAPAKSYHM